MSSMITRVLRSSRSRKTFAGAALMLAALGTRATILAQEEPTKTFVERAREYRDKIITHLESTSKAAAEEYGTVRAKIGEATGASREKLAARMEALGKKWAAAREKLTASLDAHARSVGEEIKRLEAKAAEASGTARDRSAVEIDRLRTEWTVTREKLNAALSSNMKAARDEFAHLKERSATASAEAKARLAPRMESLRAEWSRNREKLAAHLDHDLKQTKEAMDKLGEQTSSKAKLAREKLAKKYQELRGRSDELAKEKSIDDAN